VLGNSAQEQERLKLQARFLEKWTGQFLLSAGVEPGMNVLDLGCGMGDVPLLAARLVGSTGHVTGIDRDLVLIKKARERAWDEARAANIQFTHRNYFISTRTDPSMPLSGATFCFFSLTRLPQSLTQQDNFAPKESLCSMKWIWPIEFEATRTGRFLKKCTPSLQRLTGAPACGWIQART